MAHTVGQIAQELGKNPDTMRRYLSRRYADNYPGQSWGASAVVPDNVAAELLAKSGTKKERVQRASAPVVRIARTETPAPVIEVQEAPAPAKMAWGPILSFTRSTILIGIVLGHALLVWYDCADLWSTPGAIGGGLVFFIVLAAVMFAADPDKYETRSFSLAFVALVDFAAFFVHYPVFSEYGVDSIVTKSLCAFVCICSWAALALYQNSKS